MFNMMVKMRSRKGFSLVEMLVVIAIIAILVAIIVPAVGASKTKAAAATNAANLRSIEATLTTMKVSNADYFIARAETSPTSWWASAVNRWFGSDVSTALFNTYPAENGTLTLYKNGASSGDSITLENVPLAKGVSTSGMVVDEGSDMIIYLVDNAIVATYESADGNGAYNKDDFAEVAETGKFTGEGTMTEGDVADKVEEAGQKVLCAIGLHTGWSDNENGTHSCQCGEKTEKHSDDSLTSGNDGKCDECGVTISCSHVMVDKGIYHECSECGGERAAHTYTNGVCVCNKTHPTCRTWTDFNSDSKCDTCSCAKSEHNTSTTFFGTSYTSCKNNP